MAAVVNIISGRGLRILEADKTKLELYKLLLHVQNYLKQLYIRK